MSPKDFFAASAVAATVLWAGAASAAALVTFNPSNNNNGLGVISAADGQFQALGAQGFLNTTLTINAATGNNVGFTETGTFTVQNFTTSPATPPLFGVVPSGVLNRWNLVADINFSGVGNWNGNLYEATGGSFSLTLRALDAGFNNLFTLGTASLIFGADSDASVTLVNATNANTSISGTFDFTPAAGTTGPNGFFVAPDPFQIGFSVGNFGGNAANTTYTVSPLGVVTVFTPGPGLNAATGNLTFVAVPEPGALALVGIALLAGGVVSARTRRTKANG